MFKRFFYLFGILYHLPKVNRLKRLKLHNENNLKIIHFLLGYVNYLFYLCSVELVINLTTGEPKGVEE